MELIYILYIIKKNEIKNNYPGIKKIEIPDTYSSNTVEELTKDELNKIILKTGLLD